MLPSNPTLAEMERASPEELDAWILDQAGRAKVAAIRRRMVDRQRRWDSIRVGLRGLGTSMILVAFFSIIVGCIMLVLGYRGDAMLIFPVSMMVNCLGTIIRVLVGSKNTTV